MGPVAPSKQEDDDQTALQAESLALNNRWDSKRALKSDHCKIGLEVQGMSEADGNHMRLAWHLG